MQFNKISITASPENILFSHGQTSGLVVDCGHSQTSVTPIIEGFIVKYA
jgi:actin-related protein